MNAANNVNPPVVFTQDELGWVSWIDPLLEAELTERHFAGLVDRSRSKSEDFRLLVRDPEVLEARTKTDKDIFYNVADGLPRAERELAAGARSRRLRPRAITAASTAPPCTRVSPALIPSAATMCSGCSTRALAPI